MEQLDDIPLTAAERAFAAKLLELFARVDAAAPERGVRTLLRRARRAAAAGRGLEDALADEYAGAKKRTEKRLEAAARSACTRRS